MSAIANTTRNPWWLELRHNGMVIAPALLDRYFPDGPQRPSSFAYQRLRERYMIFDAWFQRENAYEPQHRTPLYTWLDGVLEIFLGHEQSRWQKRQHIDERWRHKSFFGESMAPDRILFCTPNQQTPALFVWIEPTRQLAYGDGRNAYGKLLELLRAKQVRLGLLTNGRQFRLCYAGLDHDSWVEWDATDWFDEEELRERLYGFYTLLGPKGLGVTDTETQTFPLLQAAEESRTRQGDLSLVLGERVRQSVEMLLNEVNNAVRSNPALLDIVRVSPQGIPLSQRRVLEALYQAAVRIILRMVIIFFAEARDMLPRSLTFHQDDDQLRLAPYPLSYSLENLYEQLRRAEQSEGPRALAEQYGAWSRLLSLFYTVYRGSWAAAMPVHGYGGLLFRPGESKSADVISRAVALFESPEIAISDAVVLQLLKLLKNGRVRVQQGHSSRWVSGPVDFSELRTEYIGLMYQGLLDFNLFAADEPMVFLNLGLQPVLPLPTLEAMSDRDLRDLLKKLRTEKAKGPTASEEDTSESEEDDDAVEADITDECDAEDVEETPDQIDMGDETSEADESAATVETVDGDDEMLLTESERRYRRALAWAERAVEVGGLLPKPKGHDAGLQYRYQQERRKAARRLIKQVLDKGEFYLVRRGGTRKGSGTFYTRPQLAVPIAQYTLEPLLYTTDEQGKRVPRLPEEILSVKVCDPACGSASFLVAALHYMTDALYESLVYHRRLRETAEETHEQTVVHLNRPTLPLGTPSRGHIKEEFIPVRPNNERFEPLTKAKLRRHVVEQCIYGIDLSPLAVELARISLWIETMDRDLPFTFLDHKIKVGNALVGAWLDTFSEYPLLAWQREGGENEWTRAIKQLYNETIKKQMVEQIKSSMPQLIPTYVQQTPEHMRSFSAALEAIHSLSIEESEEREAQYRALQERPDYQELKHALDRWCAAWFWPADELNDAPRPDNFYAPNENTRRIVAELAADLRFFHWELEFPDVFDRPVHGFDAILANPPWETSKPNSKEFFSDYDPLYRTYGKQEALERQRHLFARDMSVEREWRLYQSYFKSMSNWVKHACAPFGDPKVNGKDAVSFSRSRRESAALHDQWRSRRAAFAKFALADRAEPFQYQGSADLNTYKMFLEVAYHLLKAHGRLGMLVPSGIYTDNGSRILRKLFLDNSTWHWLFGFINQRRVFDIDSRFKFVVVLLEKGGQTTTLRATFNQPDLASLEQAEQFMLDVPRERVERFSPYSLVIIEAQTQRDVAILEKLYQHSVLLGSQDARSWQIAYSREFDMTNNSKLFPPLPQWEARGYRPDGYGRWIDDNGNVALPLYEGRMIGAFDPSEKGWVSGKGRGAKWRDIPADAKAFNPQYLISLDDYKERGKARRGNKIGFMDIASATNTRSMYATFIESLPSGHTVSILQTKKRDVATILSLIALLNSFVYDYTIRCRLGGLHLSEFILNETPLIPPSRLLPTICAQLAGRLNLIMPCFAPQWLELRAAYPQLGEQHWRRLWAITPHERLRLRCILDAIIAELYGLEYDDLAWILRGDPNNKADRESNPKGFWRVDDKKPEALRQTTLTLAAFRRLKEVGLAAFSGEDWQFPADVAAQLGPRFTPWQEEGTIEQSWQECEQHAQNVKKIMPSVKVEAARRGSSNGRTHSDSDEILPLIPPGDVITGEQLSLWGEDDEK
jgi:hypothetical protein